MLHQTIKLKDHYNIDGEAELTTYVIENSAEIDPERRRPAVLIFPGGGYRMVSDREAEPIALSFVSKGYNAFVLRYSTKPSRYPAQLLEASAAMTFIRRNADEYNTIPGKIAVCGFSSGGHLACSLGALWNEQFIQDTLDIKKGENRPDAMILCYPVITADERYAHKGSFEILLGENPDKENLRKLSLENSVGQHTPPAFIWHTMEDGGVLPENSLILAKALRKHGVDFEMHLYPFGVHGLSLATEETKSPTADRINPHVSSWFGLCANWLKLIFEQL
jgi:acetyl esterase/lipase